MQTPTSSVGMLGLDIVLALVLKHVQKLIVQHVPSHAMSGLHQGIIGISRRQSMR